MIGIASYLPDDSCMRELRKQAINKEIEFIRDVFGSEPIYIVSQNYHKEDYIDGINYIDFKDGIGLPKARNEIFKLFYASNDDYLYLCDDDNIIYDYYDSKQLIRDVYFGKYNDYNIDMLIPLTPDMSPFKELVYKEDFTHNHILKRATLTSGNQMVLIKNIRKFYNKELYVDEKSYVTYQCDETVVFIGDFIANGFTAYLCINWIKKILNKNNSVIFSGDISHNDRKKFIDNSLTKVFNKYCVANIHEFHKKYNKTLNKLYVKRPYDYKITDNLIPKNKETKSKLF